MYTTRVPFTASWTQPGLKIYVYIYIHYIYIMHTYIYIHTHIVHGKSGVLLLK
jgi:hypothetical protein